ncbi:hypothetical protein HNS38_16650 [Lentimicrobium sp. L6]|uniref:hypothetical protein n=1 Tax=Lentimicrobium sp. L6 TaxID=2735916 RepID=UPI001552CF77|nr:hypothetical protein [Lentimicrobium sp. L6]NPD86404.1 hypothetical protein [Lentimicrobium sp. L6]
MKKHEVIFEKVKNLLTKYFPDQIEENENGMYLSIKDTGLWISADPRELTIGYGMTHIHCDPEYDNLNEAIELFFNLMTCKKQITKYYKGDFSYKHRIDLLLADNEVYNLGTAMTWLFPYWKKTIIKVEIEDEIIELNKVENDMNEIKTMHNN